MTPALVVGGFLVLAGVGFVVSLVVRTRRYARLLEGGAWGAGVVLEDGVLGDGTAMVVEWVDAQGAAHTYSSQTTSSFFPQTGAKVRVLYDPHDPSKLAIEGVHDPTRWIEGVIAVVLIGSGLLVWSLL